MESNFYLRADILAESPIQQLTLRELLTEAERLARELEEHLEQNFLPKLQRLDGLVQPGKDETLEALLKSVKDVTVRTQVMDVIESDQFTQQVYKKLEEYCQSIDSATSRIVAGE